VGIYPSAVTWLFRTPHRVQGGGADVGVRSRTISLIAGTALVLGLAMASAAAVYGTQASNEADTRAANGVLDNSAAVVASELDRLAAVCGDWAPWDDTFHFVKQHDSAYIRSNLGESTLSNLGVDFMVFVDASGRILYASALDPATRRASTLPPRLVRYLATQPGPAGRLAGGRGGSAFGKARRAPAPRHLSSSVR